MCSKHGSLALPSRLFIGPLRLQFGYLTLPVGFKKSFLILRTSELLAKSVKDLLQRVDFNLPLVDLSLKRRDLSSNDGGWGRRPLYILAVKRKEIKIHVTINRKTLYKPQQISGVGILVLVRLIPVYSEQEME